MAFPSTLSSFTYPNANNRLNSPSHSSVHAQVASAIGQLEAVIGTDASTLGTIIGDLRSASSGGGGHIQTANKGGTGQTTYTKGDLLIATSSSVLAKLAVSSTAGDVLVADPNQNAGIKWAAVVANKVAVNSTSLLAVSTTSVTTLFAASILGSTLGSNNAVKFTGQIRNLKFTGGVGSTYKLIANYGNNVAASVTLSQPNGSSLLGGLVEGMIVGNGGISSQASWIKLHAQANNSTDGAAGYAYTFGSDTSSVESSANQNLTVTMQVSGSSGIINSVLAGTFVVEKFV